MKNNSLLFISLKIFKYIAVTCNIDGWTKPKTLEIFAHVKVHFLKFGLYIFLN